MTLRFVLKTLVSHPPHEFRTYNFQMIVLLRLRKYVVLATGLQTNQADLCS